MPEIPIACSLNAAELGQRGRAWSELKSRWGLGGSRLRDAVVLSFTCEPDAIARLQQLVDLERECCAWIDFEIMQRAQTVDLLMRATPDGLPVVAEMFGMPQPASQGH